MLNNIFWTILTCTIGVAVPGLIGYLLGAIKSYRKKEKTQNEALKCLLRNNITSKYYVYTQLGYVPIYEKENVTYAYEQYKNMGGNSYIDVIMVEFNELPMKEGLNEKQK